MRDDLPDVNVWVALALKNHPFHARAHEYWRTDSASALSFCRTSALGFVRVCSMRATVGEPFTHSESWNAYQGWRRQPGVAYLEEPEGLESLLGGWAQSGIVTPRTWTDAYLAAFAIRAGVRLVSFDADFRRFPGLDSLHLSA